MKNLIILLTLLISINSYSQVDFVKYFNEEKIEIENVESEDGKLYIDDKEVKPKNIELLYFNDKLTANVFKVDAKDIKYLSNFHQDYLFADRFMEGKINLFMYKVSSGSNNYKGERIFFNQGLDGKVSIASTKNLKPILQTNKESFKYFKKANFAEKSGPITTYIGFGVAAAGLGMFLYDMTTGYNNPTLSTAGIITASAGGVIFVVNFFIPHGKTRNKNLKKAVEIYNK